MPKTGPSQYRDETALTLIFIKTIAAGNFILSVLQGEVKSLPSSTSHEVVECYPSTAFRGVVAWFKDYISGVYNLLKVSITEHCQEHSLSSTIVEEESSSEYPTALTFILDAQGMTTLAMLDALLPPSPGFLMMTNQWWEELFLSFSNVTPLGESEDWESTRKSKVVEVVRAISSRGDINEGFIVLLLKMVNTVDARHQVSWTVEQLHWRHEEVRVVNAVPTNTQLGDPMVMTGQGQLATVPRNVTALKSTVSRKEPLAPTEITKNYLPQANSEELSKSLPVKEIRNESTLECPPAPSEWNSLNEIKRSPERPPFSKGDNGQEDVFEDGDMLGVPCTEENPQNDELVENEERQITCGTKSCVTSAAERIKGVEHPASSLSHGDTPGLKHSEPCSEVDPQKDQEVRNGDEDVTRASRGPFVFPDGDVKVSCPSTEEKPKKDILV